MNRGALTLSQALTGPSLGALEREGSYQIMLAFVAAELERVSKVTGTVDAEALMTMAEMVCERWRNRTITALRIALRDGLNNGKIYGKLTYPVIAEWLNEHEEKIEAHHYEQHSRTK